MAASETFAPSLPTSCPCCGKIVKSNKNGKLARHGRQGIKQGCPGSGAATEAEALGFLADECANNAFTAMFQLQTRESRTTRRELLANVETCRDALTTEGANLAGWAEKLFVRVEAFLAD